MASPCFLSPIPLHSSLSKTVSSSQIAHSSFARGTFHKKCRLSARPAFSTVRAEAEELVKEQLAWVDAIELSQVNVGKLQRVVLAGLDICIACDNGGQVYALGNKGPPLGVPLSDGSIIQEEGTGYLQCPQYGTLFDLSTGKVKDAKSWIRSPPFVSNLLRLIFSEPSDVPVYAVRESADILQVCVNVNARAQYEKKYWKGILDASGKADGGYY